MLFKLLSDYSPRGVAVAWDTRPTHRTEIAETYKEGRRADAGSAPRAVPALPADRRGVRLPNLEFEGWEADDVIATLATRADDAGIRTCVVSTDRDAFQLCSENVSLMMTPRGVADVHVYTPERVELRYGVRPDQVPDFIGLKGDTSDNIPGIPGIGDKTAGQLIAQYGSLEDVIAHADELSPARSKAVTEYADQARASKVLATMRRDLPLEVDAAELVASPPDRSTMKEIFRRFEFRGLLGRVDTLDGRCRPRAAVEADQSASRGGRARSSEPQRAIGARDRRTARCGCDRRRRWSSSAASRASSGGPRNRRVGAHDAKRPPRPSAADDTMIAAYLVDPGRRATSWTTSRGSTGSSSCRSQRRRRRPPRWSGAPRPRAGAGIARPSPRVVPPITVRYTELHQPNAQPCPRPA